MTNEISTEVFVTRNSSFIVPACSNVAVPFFIRGDEPEVHDDSMLLSRDSFASRKQFWSPLENIIGEKHAEGSRQ